MLTCIANGISIYSPHTALDSVKGGVNDWLASLLSEDRQGKGIRDVEILGEEKDGGAGIGRKVVFSDAVALDEVVRRVKAGLGLKHGVSQSYLKSSVGADLSTAIQSNLLGALVRLVPLSSRSRSVLARVVRSLEKLTPISTLLAK